MRPTKRIAVVGPADATRAELASYLRHSGFDVHECAELGLPGAFADLVLLGPTTAIVACARRWLRITKQQRIVVIADEPEALDALRIAFAERLSVLRAPAHIWRVLDVLCERDATAIGPEFAP